MKYQNKVSKSKYSILDNQIIERVADGESHLSISKDPGLLRQVKGGVFSGLRSYIQRMGERDSRFATRVPQPRSGTTTYDPKLLEKVKKESKDKKLPEMLQPTIDERLEMDSKYRKLRTERQEAVKKYNIIVDKYDNLKELFDNAMYLKDAQHDTNPITYKRLLKSKSSIGFTQWSDWHIGETVKAEVVNGRNEHNPEVHAKRVEKLGQSTVQLVRSLDLAYLVVHLGGDFINGWIHPENTETNSMTPIEETLSVEGSLIRSFDNLLNNTKLNIKVIANVGNHGRMTKKYRFGSEVQTSYETLIYHNLAQRYSSNKRIDFVLPESSVVELEIGGQWCRFIHGHQVKYNGGVGGITVSLNKKVANWDKTQKCDMNFMCHYHQAHMPNSKTMMNGSLVGYNGMALFYGFEYERAQQSFIMYHPEYGWSGFYRLAAE